MEHIQDRINVVFLYICQLKQMTMSEKLAV